MKNSILKALCLNLLIVTTLIMLIPSFACATEDTTSAIILEKTGGKKLIYIQNMEATDFKYAFSDDSKATDLTYTTCQKDSNGENVAVLEAGETYKYMFLATESGTEVIEIDSMKKITDEEIEQIGKLTTIINVDTTESESVVSKSEDGTTVTKTRGKIVITDEGTYQYQIIEILDKNNSTKTLNETAVGLYENLTNLANATKMYDKLSVEIEIRDAYNTLISEATWEDVTDSTILEPEDAQEGEKYIVLIQEVKDGKSVRDDIKFMTCDRADDEDVEYTNTEVVKVVEKKSKLPVTGENIAIYIALTVVIIAIIAVAVRMKYLKGKENDQK